MLITGSINKTTNTIEYKRVTSIIKEVGEVVLIIFGAVDREKYLNIIGGRCHERN